MSVSLVGLGVLTLASAQVFTVFKWVGAAYLIWLGIRTFRSAQDVGQNENPADPRTSSSRAFRQCFGVTALNPKPIAFFIAFVPQFINTAAPLLPQFSAAIATFTGLAWLNAYFYARLAGRMSGVIRRPSIIAWFKRVSGTILVGMGLATLTLRRSSIWANLTANIHAHRSLLQFRPRPALRCALHNRPMEPAADVSRIPIDPILPIGHPK